MEQGLAKKLKGSDGLRVPTGDETWKSNAGGTALNVSQRVEHDIALEDRSNGNTGAEITERNDRAGSKQIRDIDVEADSSTQEKANETYSISQNTLAIENFTGYVEALCEDAGNNVACVVSAAPGLPSDASAVDERQLKRERRKQANRESARKSRLRKQAEYEELMQRWNSLKMENSALRSELERLNADSERLRRENSALMKELEVSGVAQKAQIVSSNAEADLAMTNDAGKVLDESNNLRRNVNLDHDACENANSETKFNQMLEPSSRSDTVTAR